MKVKYSSHILNYLRIKDIPYHIKGGFIIFKNDDGDDISKIIIVNKEYLVTYVSTLYIECISLKTFYKTRFYKKDITDIKFLNRLIIKGGCYYISKNPQNKFIYILKKNRCIIYSQEYIRYKFFIEKKVLDMDINMMDKLKSSVLLIK